MRWDNIYKILFRDGESCIFRVQPDHPGQVQLTLLEEEGFLPTCDVAEVHIVVGGNVIGPFCYDAEDKHRRKRHTGVETIKEEVTETDGEIDMVYSKTGKGGMPNGDGFKFKFQFSFEWELLPGGGKPGEYQEGYSDNVKPYVPTKKPYTKPTYKPTPKPTYKTKTTKYTTEAYTTPEPETYTTTKYKTKPTYKPETYTTEEYKTEPTYKPTYKPTTYKTKPSYYTNKPYNGGNKPYVKPYGKCPWETNHGYATYAGDCPGADGLCNLKYFKVCGQSFFNKVYNDVCKWQDAAQLIPMVTSKLVPLGHQYEKAFGTKCNGLNYEEKSIQELFGGVVPDEERDVAKCRPKAGAVPCEYINFHGVTTAREFHLKVEKLYHDYLKKLCNKEWQVHFEALMKRMRGSLFCDDGGTPDHPGYTPSPPPPPYVPDYETTEPYKTDPYKPTPTPYTPTPYKSKTPYTPKPYTTTRPYVPPTYAPVMKCPWKYGGNYMASYKGDCQKDEGMCNLKYFKVCGQNFFNKVYKGTFKNSLIKTPRSHRKLSL